MHKPLHTCRVGCSGVLQETTQPQWREENMLYWRHPCPSNTASIICSQLTVVWDHRGLGQWLFPDKCCCKQGMLEQSIFCRWNGSSDFRLCVNMTILVSFTECESQFLLYISTVQRSRRCMWWCESRLGLVGFRVTATRVSVNSKNACHDVFLPIYKTLPTRWYNQKKRGIAWQCSGTSNCEMWWFWMSLYVFPYPNPIQSSLRPIFWKTFTASLIDWA